MDRDVTALERDYFADKNPDKLERLVAATLRAQRPLTHLFGDIALKPARFVPYGLGDNLEYGITEWAKLASPELFAFDRVMYHAQHECDREHKVLLRCGVFKVNYDERVWSPDTMDTYVIKDPTIIEKVVQTELRTPYTEQSHNDAVAFLEKILAFDKPKPLEHRRVYKTNVGLTINKREMKGHPFLRFLFCTMQEPYVEFLKQRTLTPFSISKGRLDHAARQMCFLVHGNSQHKESYSLVPGNFDKEQYSPTQDNTNIQNFLTGYGESHYLTKLLRIEEDLINLQKQLPREKLEEDAPFTNLLKAFKEYKESVDLDIS